MIRSDGAGSKDELRAPFVERRTYRRRRLMDIARIAPILGALLFLVPLLWPEHQVSDGGAQGDSNSMSSAMIYIFGVWIGLILFAVGFSVAVRFWAVHWTGVGPPTDTADVLTMHASQTDKSSASAVAARQPTGIEPEDDA